MQSCPGRYCGRTLFENKSWSNECGACLRGFRSDGIYCNPCNSAPEFYDWLFLLFMALIALLLHWFFIDLTANQKIFSKEALILHSSAFAEVLLAAVITLLLVDPMGSIEVTSCRSIQLSDWYTLFHNPNPNYQAILHCTQEAVYPLYSMVFIFYGLATIIMLVVRPWLTNYLRFGWMTVYAGLYFYPILALLHAVLGGVIYYTYPYAVIVGSLISSATHFACKSEQTMKALVISSMTNLRCAVILLGHWLLHGYGIIAVTQLKQPPFHGALLALVPLPTVFYILTSRFTDPTKSHTE